MQLGEESDRKGLKVGERARVIRAPVPRVQFFPMRAYQRHGATIGVSMKQGESVVR